MRTITKEVYTFQELIDLNKGTEKARQWLCEAATSFDWYDCVYETWVEALDQIGFTDAKINFSGFGCQGDGASFTSNIDVERLATFLSTEIAPENCIKGDPEDFRPWIVHKCRGVPTNHAYRRLAGLGEYLSCKVVRTSHSYSHELTCGVEVEVFGGRADKVDALAGAFEKDVETLRYALCKAIYRDLEKEYEYLTSDEALLEMAEANDYTFTINGTREG
jgi:hypothetical protein